MLKAHFETIITALEKRLDERATNSQESLRTAWAANEQRLHSMNEFREVLSDQAATFITRKESETARQVVGDKTEDSIRRLTDKIDADIGPLRERLEVMARPNWSALMGSVSVLLVIIAGGYTIMGLKIDTAITPNATAIVALQEHARQLDTGLATATNRTTASTQADLVSQGDRAQINARLATLEQGFIAGSLDRRAAQATTTASLIEVETQFRALSHYVNTLKDNDGQLFGLLWRKAYNEDLPPTPFRPEFFRQN